MAQFDASVGSACVFTKPFLPWSILSGIHIKIKPRFAHVFVLCFLKASRVTCNQPPYLFAYQCLFSRAVPGAVSTFSCLEEPVSSRGAGETAACSWHWGSALTRCLQLHRSGKALRWKLWWTPGTHACTPTSSCWGMPGFTGWPRLRVLYGSEDHKSAFFLVCTWGGETTQLVIKYEHTYYLCVYEFLPKNFFCICKGENLSFRCFYMSLNERASKIHIQIEVLCICELIF